MNMKVADANARMLGFIAKFCHVLNPVEDGVRRPVKRRVQTPVI